MGEGGVMAKEDEVRFEGVTCKAESERAILVEIEGEEIWVPKSQVVNDSEVYKKGDDGVLILTRWICEQKKLV
jgi:hypothetical protein